MRDRLAAWAPEWQPETTIHYAAGCLVCGAPCSEPGWLKFEAISTGICRCCIETIAKAAPDVARAALATEPQAKESTR